MPYSEVMFASTSEMWSTPQATFDALNEEFRFTLDAAATAANAKCQRFLSPEENALTRQWQQSCGCSEVVFLNPPYGKPLPQWIRKAWTECSLRSALVVMLIPARTDTAIFHDVIFPFAAEVRFLRGRLKFGGQKNSAPFPSAVVVFRPTSSGESKDTPEHS